MALVLVKHGVDHPIERTKLACADQDDRVVLIQDGVFWAVLDAVKDVKAHVYALRDDLAARGYQEARVPVSVIGYPELVDIIENEEKTIT